VNSLMAIYHPRIVYPGFKAHLPAEDGKSRPGLLMNELPMSPLIHRVKSKTKRFRRVSPEGAHTSGVPFDWPTAHRSVRTVRVRRLNRFRSYRLAFDRLPINLPAGHAFHRPST
jgi:hypothetical protein